MGQDVVQHQLRRIDVGRALRDRHAAQDDGRAVRRVGPAQQLRPRRIVQLGKQHDAGNEVADHVFAGGDFLDHRPGGALGTGHLAERIEQRPGGVAVFFRIGPVDRQAERLGGRVVGCHLVLEHSRIFLREFSQLGQAVRPQFLRQQRLVVYDHHRVGGHGIESLADQAPFRQLVLLGRHILQRFPLGDELQPLVHRADDEQVAGARVRGALRIVALEHLAAAQVQRLHLDPRIELPEAFEHVLPVVFGHDRIDDELAFLLRAFDDARVGLRIIGRQGLCLRGRDAGEAAHEGGRGHQSPGDRTQRAVVAAGELRADGAGLRGGLR